MRFGYYGNRFTFWSLRNDLKAEGKSMTGSDFHPGASRLASTSLRRKEKEQRICIRCSWFSVTEL
jgi:hypothetical protein